MVIRGETRMVCGKFVAGVVARGDVATAPGNVATTPSPSRRVSQNSPLPAPGCRDGEGAVATVAPAHTRFPTHFPGADLSRVVRTRGNLLPHWTLDGATYHICFRLADSAPRSRLREWDDERRRLSERLVHADDSSLSEAERSRLKRLVSEKIETYLDSGVGTCILKDSRCAEILRETLLHDDGRAYRLHAYGIMPNHVHVIVAVARGDDVDRVVRAWKSVSGHRINRVLSHTGALWQTDSFNRIIRSEADYRHQVSYVFGNDGVETYRSDGGQPVVRRRGVVVAFGKARGCRDGEGAVATVRVSQNSPLSAPGCRDGALVVASVLPTSNPTTNTYP